MALQDNLASTRVALSRPSSSDDVLTQSREHAAPFRKRVGVESQVVWRSGCPLLTRGVRGVAEEVDRTSCEARCGWFWGSFVGRSVGRRRFSQAAGACGGACRRLLAAGPAESRGSCVAPERPGISGDPARRPAAVSPPVAAAPGARRCASAARSARLAECGSAVLEIPSIAGTSGRTTRFLSAPRSIVRRVSSESRGSLSSLVWSTTGNPPGERNRTFLRTRGG
jgi:hypothetical protein